MIIKRVIDIEQKKHIARNVLEALPDWFGIKDAREQYINESSEQSFFCASIDNKPVGFIALKETSKDTLELAVMGVLSNYHRSGIGKALFENSKDYAIKNGYSFIQVKTVKMGKYEIYDRTNMFYLALGFKEFEVFPLLWGEENPCQIYVMSI